MRGMEDDLSMLPEPYSRYFELRGEGYREREIAAELGIPEDAMEAFIALAHAKRARRGDHAPHHGPERPS